MNTLISQLPWLARMRSRPIPVLIGVVALLLAATFLVISLLGSASVSRAVDAEEVVNNAGRYRFEAPEGWSTTQQGRTTTVTSPDQATVVTLGVGRVGTLPVAGTAFFQEVARNYKNVEVIPPDAKDVGKLPALVYGGVGINAENTKIRFLAITIKGNSSNYSIAVFTAAGSDPQAVLPPVNQLVDTFRALI